MFKGKIYLFLLAVLLFSLCNIATAQNADKWNIEKSTHFIIYYKKLNQDFLDQLINHAEQYYDMIADDLGFRRYDFWLWDNRAKIYVYNDKNDYMSSTGQPSWSAGCAQPREKAIHTYPYAQGFFEIILPHELGHIIFREFVGFNNLAVPVWLDEGVAAYQERQRYATSGRQVRKAIEKGNLIPIHRLSMLNPQAMQDQAGVSLFYAEAISIVDYLIKQFGKDNFVLFCQRLRDGKNLQAAMESSYPFKDIDELGNGWQEYLKAGYGNLK